MAPPSPIFIFDSTRLRSHLFFRFLSTSPSTVPIYHPFMLAGLFGPERYNLDMNMSEARIKAGHDQPQIPLPDTQEMARKQLVQALGAVDACNKSSNDVPKIPIINEHWFFAIQPSILLSLVRGQVTTPDELTALARNPTRIPDDLFATMRPIVLIRHPIYSVDSIYRGVLLYTHERPGDEDFTTITAVQPMRLLYDFFRATDRRPMIVDGDDVLWRTADLSRNVCAALGVEPMTDTWTPTSKEDIEKMHPLIYALTKDIHDSSGIIRPSGGKPAAPQLEDAVNKWTEKYGGEVAVQLRDRVLDALPHYEYLSQFKL